MSTGFLPFVGIIGTQAGGYSQAPCRSRLSRSSPDKNTLRVNVKTHLALPNIANCVIFIGRHEVHQMNRIEQYRKKTGLTQQQAADAAGWKYQSRWSSYERGDRIPDIYDANAIVQVLNTYGAPCSVEDVFPPKNSEQPKTPTTNEAA